VTRLGEKKRLRWWEREREREEDAVGELKLKWHRHLNLGSML
jgi:hypothetical protein